MRGDHNGALLHVANEFAAQELRANLHVHLHLVEDVSVHAPVLECLVACRLVHLGSHAVGVDRSELLEAHFFNTSRLVPLALRTGVLALRNAAKVAAGTLLVNNTDRVYRLDVRQDVQCESLFPVDAAKVQDEVKALHREVLEESDGVHGYELFELVYVCLGES